MKRILSIALGALAAVSLGAAAHAESTQKSLMDVHWSFEGPFGSYDQQQLQRGFKVYREVCSSCHTLKMIAFRNLGDPGGPFWNPKYPNPNDNPVVKAIAKDYQVADIDSDTGDAIKRPGITADYFPSPFANDTAARAANGGALPPDMSMLAAAREGGARYIYSVVMGDGTPAQAGLTLPPNKYYDPYMPGDMSGSWAGDKKHVPEGGVIAMPPPLTDNRVTFDDKTVATKAQEARDVAAFLKWASDPKLEERHHLGIEVMIFLALFTSIVYLSYRRIWANVGH